MGNEASNSSAASVAVESPLVMDTDKLKGVGRRYSEKVSKRKRECFLRGGCCFCSLVFGKRRGGKWQVEGGGCFVGYFFSFLEVRKVLECETENVKDVYEFGEVLGRGSFGICYRGTHKRSGQQVAIKTISKGKLELV